MSRLGNDSGSIWSDYPNEWATGAHEEEDWDEVWEEREDKCRSSIRHYYEKFRQKSHKVKVTCPYDKDVFDWFKAKGKGYQSIINAALKAVMQVELDKYGGWILGIPISVELNRIFLSHEPKFDAKSKCAKVSNGIWYDPEVIKWFKSKGKNYLPLMNNALRAVMEIEKQESQEIDTEYE